MKKILWIVGVITGLAACNDDSKSTTTADTTTMHETHTDEMTGMDTAGMSGKTMMSMMQANMDQMRAMTSTGNPDNDYAAMMKTHHMGAVEMIQLELAQGTDAAMKQMAQKMLREQQKEIAELNTFLSGHSAHGGGEAFHKEAMTSMNDMKMNMDHTGSVDKQFAEMMIPHHQGAINMSRIYLRTGGHEEKIKAMANKIIADQQKEIKELQAWLDANK